MSRFFIGAPITSSSLMRRDIGDTLDEMREVAGVNAVMAFSNDMVKRQYRPGFAPSSDTELYVRTDEANYAATTLRQTRDPHAFGSDRDLIDELLEAAAPREMHVIARILEPYVITGSIAGLERCSEIDVHGERTDHACFNHPDYLAFWEAVVVDLVRLHPGLWGFKFGQERGGPLFASLNGRPGTCFCEHCRRWVTDRGIDFDQAGAAMLALEAYAQSVHPEGGWIEFLRLLADHPVLLPWEKAWIEAREEHRKRIYAAIKREAPHVQVGWHIDHGMSWDVLFRSLWRYEEMLPHTDWFSVAVYFDCVGPRSFSHFRRNVERHMFAGSDPESAYRTYLGLLGFDAAVQPSYADQLDGQRAFSADYVRKEVSRAVRSCGGQASVFARIGFDVPLVDVPVSRHQVYEATAAALEAGADGLFCGREWDELDLENAAGFGDAVRDRTRSG